METFGWKGRLMLCRVLREVNEGMKTGSDSIHWWDLSLAIFKVSALLLRIISLLRRNSLPVFKIFINISCQHCSWNSKVFKFALFNYQVCDNKMLVLAHNGNRNFPRTASYLCISKDLDRVTV
jgi:hypothetical protein